MLQIANSLGVMLRNGTERRRGRIHVRGLCKREGPPRKGLCCVVLCFSYIGRRCRAERRSPTGWDESRKGQLLKGGGEGGLNRAQLKPWGPGLRVTSDTFVNAVSLSLFTREVKIVMQTSGGLCEDRWSSFQCSVWQKECASSTECDVTWWLLCRWWF